MKGILVAIFLILLPTQLMAEEVGRFIDRIRLPSGQTVVVAEGEFEARSIGSFSIRLYASAEKQDETTFFQDGLIHARDGVIERVLLEEISGDDRPEIIVVARSVGSGNYLAGYAFAYGSEQLTLLAFLEGMSPEKNPAAELRHRMIK